MSLYRQWRPPSFTDLVGQDAVVRTLSQALTTGRLVHAYLFSGPRGSGKTSAAKILARCINCERGPTPEPDNTCDHCRAILSGTALDVMEIDAASNRGIDEIRALRESVKFAPSNMRKKVYIVDEAHMLTKEGANAFLKTLEEPPEHVVFILATTAPEALPVTILSRCQRYAFRRIPIPVMVERMRVIARAEEIDVDDAALEAVAYRADGGLRDALTMLEQAASFAMGRLDLATVETAFGSSGRAYAQKIADGFIDNDAALVLRLIDEAADAGADMPNVMRSLIAEIRNVVIARVDPQLLARDLVGDDAERARARVARLPQVRALRALRLLSEALTGARMSGSPRLDFESAMLRLTLQGEDPSLEALATRVRMLEDGIGAPPSLPRTDAIHPSMPAPEPPVPTAGRPRAQMKPIESSVPSAERGEAPESSIPKSPTAPLQESTHPEVPSPAAAEPASPVSSEPTAVEELMPPSLQKVQALWPGIRARAEATTAPLRGPLSRATVERIEGWTVTVRLSDEYNAGFLRDRLATLEKALGEVLGHACRVIVTVTSGTARSTAKIQEPIAAADDLGLLDYALQRLGGTEEE